MSSFLCFFVNNDPNLLAISSLVHVTEVANVFTKCASTKVLVSQCMLVYMYVTCIIHLYVYLSATQPLDEASSPVYGNVDSQPPVPPRQGRSVPLPSKPSDGPPLPPRTRHDNGQPSRRKRASNAGERRAYFSKIFNGCPLHLNCAAAWVHPITNCELNQVQCRVNSGARPLFVAC